MLAFLKVSWCSICSRKQLDSYHMSELELDPQKEISSNKTKWHCYFRKPLFCWKCTRTGHLGGSVV